MYSRLCLAQAAAAVLSVGALLGSSAPAEGAPRLNLDLKTDYRPYEDFILVKVRFQRTEGSFLKAERVAFIGDRFEDGVRIAEIDLLEEGRWRIRTDLIDGRGGLVIRRTQTMEIRRNTAFTVLITKGPHETSAEKRVRLLSDRDGDGAVSPGDVLRYTVTLAGRGGDHFSDAPGATARLIPGSVSTSRGVVSTGNAPGDTSVSITALELGLADTATIVYDVEVVAALANQGRFFLNPPGDDDVLLRRPVFTDDPTTSLAADATVTPIACVGGSCAADLQSCRKDLGTVLADPDGDSVPALLDVCRTSPAGATVDDRGCSRAQFCATIRLDQPNGRALCRAADWRHDEPLADRPHDCEPRDGVCRAE
jgi:hypothetical protein